MSQHPSEWEWIIELKKLCLDLTWKNIEEIHSKELEFFIQETEWAITNLEEEVTNRYFQQAHVMHILLKTYVRRFNIKV